MMTGLCGNVCFIAPWCVRLTMCDLCVCAIFVCVCVRHSGNPAIAPVLSGVGGYLRLACQCQDRCSTSSMCSLGLGLGCDVLLWIGRMLRELSRALGNCRVVVHFSPLWIAHQLLIPYQRQLLSFSPQQFALCTTCTRACMHMRLAHCGRLAMFHATLSRGLLLLFYFAR